MNKRIGFGLYQSFWNKESVGRVSVFELQWCERCRWGVGRGIATGSGRVGWCYVLEHIQTKHNRTQQSDAQGVLPRCFAEQKKGLDLYHIYLLSNGKPGPLVHHTPPNITPCTTH